MSPNFYFFFFIFISCLIIVHNEYEVSNLPGHKFKTEEQIKAFLEKTDVTILAFYYKKESEKSNEIAKSLKIVYKRLRYLIDFILIDCDKSHISECKKIEEEDIEEAFYRIEMYVPPELKFNPYTKELNPHQKLRYAKSDVSDKALYKFLTRVIISREQKVTNSNYKNFISNQDLNKVILFTNKQNTPLMFRGLSGYFYDRLLIGVVHDTEKILCQKLNITKFPSVMVIQTVENGTELDEPVEIKYNGELNIDHIVKFLEKYALKKKLYLTKKADKNDEEKSLNYFVKLNPDKAMDFLKKKKSKEVILYFDNQMKDGKINYDNLPKDIKEFNAETHGYFIFGYVDCTGEEKEKKCRNNFKNKEFPNLVLYRPEKDIKGKISKAKELPLEMENIRKEINILFEPNVKIVNPLNFKVVLSEAALSKKITILYLYENNIGLGFSLFTQKELYKQFFDFIVMDKPPAEIKKNLECTYLPYISIIVPDETSIDKNGNPELKMMVYSGKYSFSGLNSFLTSSFSVNDNNLEDYSSSNSSTDDNKPAEIIFIENTEDLVYTCTKKKICVIAFFDMRPNKEIQKNFEKKFKVFKKFSEKSKNRPTSFGYINATCQEQFTSKFGVTFEFLPSAITYSYSKEVYSNFIGTFTEEELSDFVTKTLTGKTNYQRMQKENAVLQDIKCETLQPYVNTNENEDEIMKEFLAEEKKKREKFDKERNIDDDKKKNKNKKKQKGSYSDL